MKNLDIKIEWEGPLTTQSVIRFMNNIDNDYGLYQIYGKHILHKGATLLYVGIAIDETFSERFKIHNKEWIQEEGKGIYVYLGRVYDEKRHFEADKWNSWRKDIKLAESIMIYKYFPNYNSSGIANPPNLPNKCVRLIHKGNKNKLKPKDVAPDDFRKKNQKIT